MIVKIKKVSEKAILPNRETSGSAGADLYACIDEPLTITPGERTMIPSGIAIELPEPGYGAFIFPRSSLSSKHGITLANCVGVIDSDYRGEIKIPLINLSSEPYTVSPCDRIAQIVIMPVELPVFEITDHLTDTSRGDGGFGSTGK